MVKLYLVLAIVANMVIMGESFFPFIGKVMNKVMGVHHHGESDQGSGTCDKNKEDNSNPRDNPEHQPQTKSIFIPVPQRHPPVYSQVYPPLFQFPPAPVNGYPQKPDHPSVIVHPSPNLASSVPVYKPMPVYKPVIIYKPVPVNTPTFKPQPNPIPSYPPATLPPPSPPCKDNNDFTKPNCRHGEKRLQEKKNKGRKCTSTDTTHDHNTSCC